MKMLLKLRRGYKLPKYNNFSILINVYKVDLVRPVFVLNMTQPYVVYMNLYADQYLMLCTIKALGILGVNKIVATTLLVF